MRIFQLNDYEWWYAETLKKAYAEAEKQTGVTEKEQREDFEPVEITEEEMDRPGKVTDDEISKKSMSYREALDLATADGSKAGILCGIE